MTARSKKPAGPAEADAAKISTAKISTAKIGAAYVKDISVADRKASEDAAASALAATPAATRTFVVASAILHDGDMYAAGEDIALTKAQLTALHAAGAVTGTWSDADDGAA